MRDQHDDQVFQAFRGEFGRSVVTLVRSVAYAFDRLTAQLYDAPWSRLPRAAERPCGPGSTIL